MPLDRKFMLMLAGLFCLGAQYTLMAQNSFVQVTDSGFVLNGEPYHFLGTNFWAGMNLGAAGEGGDRPRLIRELDQLSAMGVKNLRIMAASEGPDTEPWRVVPSLQPSKGQYNDSVLDGLDFLLAEMAKRDMKAVVCLNNFWPWSGGMAQYFAWEKKRPIPYPPPAEGGDWARYQLFASRFYKNRAALKAAENHIRFIVSRHNPYTGRPYAEEPAIMAWELANEPRGLMRGAAYLRWIRQSAALIKSLDSNHLVTIGSEGYTSSRFAGTRFERAHKIPGIDYACLHLWVQNWGIYDPLRADETYLTAEAAAIASMHKHLEIAEKIGMPLVFEEFGLSRDNNDHNPDALASIRNRYYQRMFEEVAQLAEDGRAMAGCNFWAWAGEGRPREPKCVWLPGDPLTGDPPHEYQGWYSVYDTDFDTIHLIRSYAQRMDAVGKKLKLKARPD